VLDMYVQEKENVKLTKVELAIEHEPLMSFERMKGKAGRWRLVFQEYDPNSVRLHDFSKTINFSRIDNAYLHLTPKEYTSEIDVWCRNIQILEIRSGMTGCRF
jgi:hypothetical protein